MSSSEGITITLKRGEFKNVELSGGGDEPLKIAKIASGSPAHKQGLRQGDILVSVNKTSVRRKMPNEVLMLIQRSGAGFYLVVTRSGCDKASPDQLQNSKEVPAADKAGNAKEVQETVTEDNISVEEVVHIMSSETTVSNSEVPGSSEVLDTKDGFTLTTSIEDSSSTTFDANEVHITSSETTVSNREVPGSSEVLDTEDGFTLTTSIEDSSSTTFDANEVHIMSSETTVSNREVTGSSEVLDTEGGFTLTTSIEDSSSTISDTNEVQIMSSETTVSSREVTGSSEVLDTEDEFTLTTSIEDSSSTTFDANEVDSSPQLSFTITASVDEVASSDNVVLVSDHIISSEVSTEDSKAVLSVVSSDVANSEGSSQTNLSNADNSSLAFGVSPIQQESITLESTQLDHPQPSIESRSESAKSGPVISVENQISSSEVEVDNLQSFSATSTEEASQKVASTDEVSLEVASKDEVSLEVVSTDEVSLEVVSTDEVPLKVASADDKSLEVASTVEVPLEVASADDKSLDVASTDEVSTKVASTDEVSVKVVSADETSLGVASKEEVSLNVASIDEVSLEVASTDEVSLEVASTNELFLNVASTVVSTSSDEISATTTSTESAETVAVASSVSQQEPTNQPESTPAVTQSDSKLVESSDTASNPPSATVPASSNDQSSATESLIVTDSPSITTSSTSPEATSSIPSKTAPIAESPALEEATLSTEVSQVPNEASAAVPEAGAAADTDSINQFGESLATESITSAIASLKSDDETSDKATLLSLDETSSIPTDETSSVPVCETSDTQVGETSPIPVAETSDTTVDETSSTPVGETSITTSTTPVDETSPIQSATPVDKKSAITSSKLLDESPTISSTTLDESPKITSTSLGESPTITSSTSLDERLATQSSTTVDEISTTVSSKPTDETAITTSQIPVDEKKTTESFSPIAETPATPPSTPQDETSVLTSFTLTETSLITTSSLTSEGAIPLQLDATPNITILRPSNVESLKAPLQSEVPPSRSISLPISVQTAATSPTFLIATSRVKSPITNSKRYDVSSFVASILPADQPSAKATSPSRDTIFDTTYSTSVQRTTQVVPPSWHSYDDSKITMTHSTRIINLNTAASFHTDSSRTYIPPTDTTRALNDLLNNPLTGTKAQTSTYITLTNAPPILNAPSINYSKPRVTVPAIILSSSSDTWQPHGGPPVFRPTKFTPGSPKEHATGQFATVSRFEVEKDGTRTKPIFQVSNPVSGRTAEVWRPSVWSPGQDKRTVTTQVSSFSSYPSVGQVQGNYSRTDGQNVARTTHQVSKKGYQDNLQNEGQNYHSIVSRKQEKLHAFGPPVEIHPEIGYQDKRFFHPNDNRHASVFDELSSPDSFGVGQNLKAHRGRGGRLFERRKKRSDKFIIDDTTIKTITPTNKLDVMLSQPARKEMSPWQAAMTHGGNVEAAFSNLSEWEAVQKQPINRNPAQPKQSQPAFRSTLKRDESPSLLKSSNFNRTARGWTSGRESRFAQSDENLRHISPPRDPVVIETALPASPRQDFNNKLKTWQHLTEPAFPDNTSQHWPGHQPDERENYYPTNRRGEWSRVAWEDSPHPVSWSSQPQVPLSRSWHSGSQPYSGYGNEADWGYSNSSLAYMQPIIPGTDL